MRRKKNNRGFGKKFVLMERQTLKSPEWIQLKSSEKLIYIYIKANYNGANNEKISFPYSEVLGEFSSSTISKAIQSLEDKGWIARTQYGGMFRYYNLYKLTGKYDSIR